MSWLGISLPEYGCFMLHAHLDASVGWVGRFSPASCDNFVHILLQTLKPHEDSGADDFLSPVILVVE